jgi:hypothetical protein
MNKNIEYLLHNYLRSNGNARAYALLMIALECDLIYHVVNQNKYE